MDGIPWYAWIAIIAIVAAATTNIARHTGRNQAGSGPGPADDQAEVNRRILERLESLDRRMGEMERGSGERR